MEGEFIIGLIGMLIIITVGIVFYILFRIYKKLYINLRNTNLHIKSYNDLNSLNRDINIEYSPAIVSYLFNQKLENKKDILATILNLYNKNAIIINKNSTEYEFLAKDDINRLNLNEDEKYLYDCCVENKEEFSIIKWNNIVLNEYDKYGFSNKNSTEKTNNKTIGIFCIIILFISIIITSFIGDPIVEKIGFSEGVFIIKFFICIFVFVIISLILSTISAFNSLSIYTRIKLTKKGKDEIKKWIKFKKFIKNYTLIKDRKIEEVVLYEKYIPYAMVLNINKEYNNKFLKEFIEKYDKSFSEETGGLVIVL